MLCGHAEELLSAFLDGELPSHESLSLEKHLRACPACTARLGELREVQAILASLEEVVPPQGFGASLHERLMTVSPVPSGTGSLVPVAPRRASRWSANRWFAAAAAAAVMAASAGSYYMQVAGTLPTTPPQVIASNQGGNNPGDSTTPDVVQEPGDSNPSGQGPTQPGPSGGDVTQPGVTAPVTEPSGNGPKTPDGVTPPAPTPRDGVGIATEPGSAGEGGPRVSSAPKLDASTEQGPLLVYQAEYQVETANMDEGLSRLVTLSQDLNGTFLSVGNSRLENGTPISIYVIRVPFARYQEARSDILAIGPTLTVSASGPQDVTAEANALRRDIESLLSQETQLREQAGATPGSGGISSQVGDLQQQIADKQARLEQLRDQARLATFRVTLVQQ